MTPDRCPICGGQFGRVDTTTVEDEKMNRYWHTDLEFKKEFCIEYADGGGDPVLVGSGGKTGPRRV